MTFYLWDIRNVSYDKWIKQNKMEQNTHSTQTNESDAEQNTSKNQNNKITVCIITSHSWSE